MSQEEQSELRILEELASEVVFIAAAMEGFTRRNLVHRKKSDGSLVSNVDTETEKRIRKAIQRWYPQEAVMGEEGSPRLPKADSFFVVDSLDGTEEFIAGGDGWAVSVAHMRGGVTHAGIVVHPMKRIALMGIRGEGVFSFEYPKLTDGKIIGKARWKAFRREDASYCKFGCDLSPVSSSRYWQEAQALTKAMKVRPNNQHAVAGGMYVALGLSAFWWSHTAHIWDLAALDVILAELGGTIAALDGSALIWDRPRMPPLVVAANRKCARIVRQAISSIP